MLRQTCMMELLVVVLLLAITVCSAQDDEACGSCRGNCDSHIAYCGCDSVCKIYNDCCHDFEDVCPDQKRAGTAILFRFRGVSRTQLAECRSVGSGNSFVPLVTACPHDEHACDVDSNRRDITSLVPVTELSTGLKFVTARCAECNGVTEAQVWGTYLVCDDRVLRQLHINNKTANSTQVKHSTLQELLVHPDCKLTIKIPLDESRTCVPDIIDTCTDGSAWSKKQCRDRSTDFVNDGMRNYKNKECVRCNAVTDPIQCGLYVILYGYSQPLIDKFSMSLLLDYSGSGLMLKSGSCEKGYTKVAHDCLPIVCPQDFELVGNDCVEIPKVDVSIHFHVTLDPGGESSKIKDLLSDPDFLIKNTRVFLEHRYDTIKNLIVSFNVSAAIELYSTEGSSLYIPGLITYTVHNMSTGDPSAHPDLMALSQVIRMRLREVFDREVDSVSTLIVEMKPLDDDDFEVWEEPSRSCSLVQLSKNEYKLQNGSIYVLSTGQEIELKHVGFGKNGSATVCESELNRNPLSSSFALGITTIVVMSISVLCLLVRIMLQFFISAFHTAPMKLQFCLVLSLFTGFLAFLLNPFLGEGSVPCHALGIYIHWVFLLAFSLMMMVAFDMWWIFRPSGGFMKLSEGAGFFWRYLMVAVLCASFITTISLLFEYTPISEPFKPNYGQFLCFFNNTRALLVFFVIPLIGIVIINLIFFTVTCINLHRALSSMQKFQQQKWKQELCLYIRLFSLMGITWVFGIVAPLLGNDILWYIFILCNGLQGLYIFMAYVCTQKVYNELKRKWSGKDPKQSVPTSRSESLTSKGSKRGKFSSTSDGNRTVDTSVSDHDSKGHFRNGNRTVDTDHGKDETDTIKVEVTNGMKKPPHETTV